jgi:hypothetical protein
MCFLLLLFLSPPPAVQPRSQRKSLSVPPPRRGSWRAGYTRRRAA